MLRILFMGTPDFAVPCLAALIAAGYPIVGVVTQPDRPSGRGGKLTPGPVKRLALNHDLPVLQPEKVRRKAVLEELQALQADLIVTVAFGQILSPAVLAVPRLGAINVHASLLPRWRGAAPIHRAVLAGDAETGITTMWMDEGLDTGDMIHKVVLPIPEDATTSQLHDQLAAAGAQLLLQTVAAIAAGTAPRTPQPTDGVTYAAKLGPDDERICWDASTREVLNQIRGLNAFPVAHTLLHGEPFKIWRAERHVARTSGTPGEVLEVVKGRGLVVATGDGAVLLLEVQPRGKKPMPAAAFLAGHSVAPGTRLGEPVVQ